MLKIDSIHCCCPFRNCCPACVWFYRDVQVFVPGGAAVLSLIVLLTLIPVTVGVRKNPRKYYSVLYQVEDPVVKLRRKIHQKLLTFWGDWHGLGLSCDDGFIVVDLD